MVSIISRPYHDGDLMSKLLIATNNQGKLIELHDLLKEFGIDFINPAQLKLALVVAENGQTYAENAALKAVAFARAAGYITLADDSGLEVEALNGEPGIHSKRYSSKPGATDADRRAYLLEKLRGRPRPWKAQFRCVIALAVPDGEIKFSEGICRGEVIPNERGQNGFGYDPIFFIPELGRTMAELTREEKNTFSHRARAVRAAVPFLREIL
jgi:XTP/dITP diphosphohydrolase